MALYGEKMVGRNFSSRLKIYVTLKMVFFVNGNF